MTRSATTVASGSGSHSPSSSSSGSESSSVSNLYVPVMRPRRRENAEIFSANQAPPTSTITSTCIYSSSSPPAALEHLALEPAFLARVSPCSLRRMECQDGCLLLLPNPSTHTSNPRLPLDLCLVDHLSMAHSIDQISRSAPPSARPDLDCLVGHSSEPPTTPSHEAEMEDSDVGSPRRVIGSRSSGDGIGRSCRCSPTPSSADSSGRVFLRQVLSPQFGTTLTVLLQQRYTPL